ncbi:MAG: Trm112 family protein [Candidatus Nanoarchaeia archaeon]|nr:Trm112 family protein [Candidatus Nanoarchaeia archaeon]
MSAKKFDEELLKILACPLCKSSLKLGEKSLICTKCSKKYAIKHGIPILLVENQ